MLGTEDEYYIKDGNCLTQNPLPKSKKEPVMARYARIELPGYMTHIMARGIDRKLIFQENSDCEQFLHRFECPLGCGGFACACIEWRLMPNHYHLILRSQGERLAKPQRIARFPVGKKNCRNAGFAAARISELM